MSVEDVSSEPIVVTLPLVPVPLNATLRLKSPSSATSLSAQHCESDSISCYTYWTHCMKVRPPFRVNTSTTWAALANTYTNTPTHIIFVCLTSDRKVCADFCAPTCSRYSYTYRANLHRKNTTQWKQRVSLVIKHPNSHQWMSGDNVNR